MHHATRRGFLRWLVELPVVAAGVHAAGCATPPDVDLSSAGDASAAGDIAAGRAGAGTLDASAVAADTHGGPALDAGTTADTASGAVGPDVAQTLDAGPDVAPTPEAGPDVAPTTDSGPDVASEAPPEVCEPTLDDAEGPFYVPDTPQVAALASPSEPGDPIAISGAVRGPECQPISGASVEVWHASAVGEYDDAKLRATLTASKDGAYAFSSIRPGPYLQSNGWRPAHIHYRVSAPGFETLITQLYFEGDPHLSPNDSCVSCGSWDDGRIIPLVLDRDGVQQGLFDLVLATA